MRSARPSSWAAREVPATIACNGGQSGADQPLELVVHALSGQDERIGRVRSGHDADARAGGQPDELHLPLQLDPASAEVLGFPVEGERLRVPLLSHVVGEQADARRAGDRLVVAHQHGAGRLSVGAREIRRSSSSWISRSASARSANRQARKASSQS